MKEMNFRNQLFLRDIEYINGKEGGETNLELDEDNVSKIKKYIEEITTMILKRIYLRISITYDDPGYLVNFQDISISMVRRVLDLLTPVYPTGVNHTLFVNIVMSCIQLVVKLYLDSEDIVGSYIHIYSSSYITSQKKRELLATEMMICDLFDFNFGLTNN